MAAFTMYTHDNSDLFPQMGMLPLVPGLAKNESNGCSTGWMPVGSAGSSDAGNRTSVKNTKLCVLTPLHPHNLALL